MPSNKLTYTMGAKYAMATKADIKATVNMEVKITRPYIWVMKWRYIWAVIRADFKK